MVEVRSTSEVIRDSGLSIDYSSIDHRRLKDKVSMDYRSIDSEIVRNDNSSPSQYRQRAIAQKLLEKLDEPKSWKFYLKCAYHLSEDKIWSFVELAFRPGVVDHNKYFVRLADNEMKR